MFDALYDKIKNCKKSLEKQNSLLTKKLAVHTTEYFVNIPRLAAFEEKNKQELINNFSNLVNKILQAENPVMENRNSLVGYLLLLAPFSVLGLNEADKKTTFYSDNQYISGELYHHIDKAVEFNDELSELKWKHTDISNDELVSFCNGRAAVYLYFVNGFNIVRWELGDKDTEKDWFRPFVTSALIYEEGMLRNKMGLPELMNIGEVVKHSYFANAVMNGHQNPYYFWEKTCSDVESEIK